MEKDLNENRNDKVKNNNINIINANESLQNEEKKDCYINNGILLIFNKLYYEYNFYIKCMKHKENDSKGKNNEEKKQEEEKKEEKKKEEEQKEEKNEEQKKEKKEEQKEEKKEEQKVEKNEEQKEEKEEGEILEDKKENEIFIKEQNLLLLEKELENTTFNEIIKSHEPNNIISSAIKDYYYYFITRNESLEREFNDLENLCKLLEMICEFQFEFSKKNNLTQKDLLSLIIWTNDHSLELNELLYCVIYFKKENIFKKNIFKEILNKKLKKKELVKEAKTNLIGIKIGMEIILSVLNDKCVEDPKSINRIIEIIPSMYQIEQKYNLNCKEIYLLLQIKYIYLLIIKSNENIQENIMGSILRQKLIPCRYLDKDNEQREEIYKSLIFSLYPFIKKEDTNKNEKYRYIIKILVQEYKKYYQDNKILDVLMRILEDKALLNLLKVSQLLFHEILSKYFQGTELNFDIIKNYNTDDYFLKLISKYSNSIYIEQILLEVFESIFNAHFMSYTNEINNTIKYEDLSNEQAEQLLKGKNLENFKLCIQLLEDKNIRESNERFLPNIVYCAYIKSYFYQFISYIFKKANQPIDVKDIVNSLTNGNNEEFKSKETKVMEIYSFRILLNYLNKNFNDFKNYNFDEKCLTYKNSFKDSNTFEDQIPKIIDFCGRTIEDFINSHQDTPLENEEEQNFYINSFLSIKIVSKAISENGISINANSYKEIWDYFHKHLLTKQLNIIYNNNDIFLNYCLSDVLIKELKSKLSNDSFQLGSFKNDQNLSHLNNKTLGIIIYIIRFCLHSYTIQGGYQKNGKTEKYFYSRLINYDSDEDIINFINSCFIPGRLNQNAGIQKIDLNTFILNNNDINNNIMNEEPKLELISILMMRFIFYSHLFFRSLLGKINDNTFSNNYSTNEGYTCLKMLISLWEKLNSNDIIPGNESNKVEIFLNRVNKEIVKEYKLCKDFDNKDNVKIFEESFNKYIIKCRNEYEYFKLIYVDKTMKAIIQENNFPLSYEKDEYPFMKYFVLISNPNMEDLKIKIKDKVNDKKLYLTDSIMNYDEKLKSENFDNFIKNNKLNKLYLFLSNFYSLCPKIYRTSEIKMNEQDDKIIKKYEEYFSYFSKKQVSELVDTIEEFINNLIETSMKFLGKFINKLKIKNYYLYKSLRRPMFSQLAINKESIIFDINKISKYKSYPHLLSKYIYKDIFTDEKEKLCEFIDFEIKIDYNRYKEFDFDIEGFEDELNSIILPDKRLFYDSDYYNKIIYNFDSFRGKNCNLLNNFILKYQDCFEEIDCEEKIQLFINEEINNFISLNFDKIDKKINCEYKELGLLGGLFTDNYNNYKNELKEKINEKETLDTIKQNVIFDIIINIYFNLLKLIPYLTDNFISGEISINDIIINMPDMYNLSNYSKSFFKSNKEYKLKNLYSIFETFEKKLFPFILLHVYDKYKVNIFDENKENISNYFEINKDKMEETKFTKRQFIDALRKFISRYLTSSDINNENYGPDKMNRDGEDLPTNTPLINYLNKNDLWPLNIYYSKDKIENGFNKLKQFNFLIKHTYELYSFLSGISFDNNGKIEKISQEKIELDESEKEYNYYKDISYFNNKNVLEQTLVFHSLFNLYNNINDFYKYFKSYNLGNIYIDYINPNNTKEDLSIFALSYSSNGLYFSIWKLNLDILAEKDNFSSKKENSVVLNNNNLDDIQNITCLKILKQSEIIIFGTNNAKLKIIKIKDNYTNIELVQELSLKGDSSNVNNILELNQNKTIIISDEKHILVFEKNEDDNNYNTYNEKKDINTGNKTYVIKIDEQNICAFIYPNIIKFYNIDNYEFQETVINDIKSDLNCNNQKEFKMMNIIGKNNNILAVCSNEHSIYIIDIHEKKLIKNCVFEGYNDNFVSVLKLNDDYVLLMDSNNNVLLTKVQYKEEKVDDLTQIGLVKKLNQDSNMFCCMPFGVSHFYFDGSNINIIHNSLN